MLTRLGRLIFCRMIRITDDEGDKRHLSTISGPPIIDMSLMACMVCLDSLDAMRIE